MTGPNDDEESHGPDWKLLAWPISGFFAGLIVTGAFILVLETTQPVAPLMSPDCTSSRR